VKKRNLLLGLGMIGLLSGCLPLAIQNVWIVLEQVNVSEETQITCTRGDKVNYSGRFNGGKLGTEANTFKNLCFAGVGNGEKVEVKAAQTTSGRTGQVGFLYTNAGGSTGIETVGFRFVVREQNAALLVECFTDINLTKACVSK
jgi:hypothetical protein